MKKVTSKVVEKKKPPDAGHLIPRARLRKMWKFHKHFNKHVVGSLQDPALGWDAPKFECFVCRFSNV